MENTLDRSTYVPPTTIKYEIMIGASQKDGDIVSDGCDCTFSFKIDYPNFIVWRCALFFSHLFQEDFILNVKKAHSRPPNYGVEKQQLTVGQSSSTTNGPSFNLENIVKILIRHLAPLKADLSNILDLKDVPEPSKMKRIRQEPSSLYRWRGTRIDEQKQTDRGMKE
jgi:hypothetical protein